MITLRYFIPNLLLTLLLVLLSACAAVVRLPGNHFMGPAVQEKPWAGEINAALSSETEVTLVNDITTNPPTRSRVLINSGANLNLGSMFGYWSPNIHLSVLPGLEINFEHYMYGLKWQFLGKNQGWIAAVQASGGSKSNSISSSTNSSSAESKTTSAEGGLSIGYMTGNGWSLPYLSFIYEDHQATTLVRSSFGTFNYLDSGIHRNTALGIMKTSDGFSFALEASYIDINWNRGSPSSQTGIASLFGFRW